MLERDIQRKIKIWLESKGCKVEKYAGSKVGEPDLHASIPLGDGRSISLYIEVKTDTGKLSNLQKIALNDLRAKGHLALVARDVKEIGGYLTKSGVKLPELSNLAIYGRWKQMKARCQNETHPKYPTYGGRGIKVCERWAEPTMGYYNFIDDMGLPPFTNASIGRIDNDGDYSPENCRWETDMEQQRNTSRNVYITANGKSQTLSEWARELGVNHKTISQRLKLGWSEDDAINIPPVIGRNGRRLI